MFVVGDDFEENVFECMKEWIGGLGTRGVNVLGDDRQNNSPVNESKEILDEECQTHDVVETARITFDKEVVKQFDKIGDELFTETFFARQVIFVASMNFESHTLHNETEDEPVEIKVDEIRIVLSQESEVVLADRFVRIHHNFDRIFGCCC
jgi:hypothetical protein